MARKMKDSGIEWIGEIPEEWQVNMMFQLFTQVKCKNTGLQEQNLLSLSYGKIKRKNIDAVGGLLPENFDGYNIIEANDIVLRLTDLQNDQKSLRVGLSNERGIVTSAYCTIRGRSTNSAKYLYYYLHAFDIAKGFYGMGAGVRQGLNWEGIKWLKFTVPSIAEQNSIADFLDKECLNIDSIIEQTCSSIEEYKKLKQAVITQAVTKGVRGDRRMKDSGMNNNVAIPEEWNAVISRFVIDSIGDVDHTMPESTENGYPYLMIGDLKSYTSEIDFEKAKKISEEDYKQLIKNTKPLKGDVIFARYATIGTVTYIDTDNEFVVSYACVTVHPKRDALLGKYLFYYFKSETFFDDVQQYINSNTQGNVGIEALFKTKIVVPTLEEQIEIVEYLDSKCAAIDSLIAQKEKFLLELEDYKKSMIYEYVTGKKEVPNRV